MMWHYYVTILSITQAQTFHNTQTWGYNSEININIKQKRRNIEMVICSQNKNDPIFSAVTFKKKALITFSWEWRLPDFEHVQK